MNCNIEKIDDDSELKLSKSTKVLKKCLADRIDNELNRNRG
jgi:hypothetical protein